jgi:hypothetical protein
VLSSALRSDLPDPGLHVAIPSGVRIAKVMFTVHGRIGRVLAEAGFQRIPAVGMADASWVNFKEEAVLLSRR